MNKFLLLCALCAPLNHVMSTQVEEFSDVSSKNTTVITVFGRCQDSLEKAIVSKHQRNVSNRHYISGDLASLYRSDFFRLNYRKKIPLFNMLDSAWANLSKDNIFKIIDNPNSSEFSHAAAFNRLMFVVENELYYFTSPLQLHQSELFEGAELISYFSKLLLWKTTSHDAENHLAFNKILRFDCGLDGAYKPYENFLDRITEYLDLGIRYQKKYLQRIHKEIEQYKWHDSIEYEKYLSLKKEGIKRLGILFSHKGRSLDLKLQLKKNNISPHSLTQENLDVIDNTNLRAKAFSCYVEAKKHYPSISKIISVSMIELIKSSGYHPTGNPDDDVNEIKRIAESMRFSSFQPPVDKPEISLGEEAVTMNLSSSNELSVKASGGTIKVKNVQKYLLKLMSSLTYKDSETMEINALINESESCHSSLSTQSLLNQTRCVYGTGKNAESKMPCFIDLRSHPELANQVRDTIDKNSTISSEELSTHFPSLTPSQIRRQLNKRKAGQLESSELIVNESQKDIQISPQAKTKRVQK